MRQSYSDAAYSRAALCLDMSSWAENRRPAATRKVSDPPSKRRLFLRGAGSMGLCLAFLYGVHSLAPVVTFPPFRLAGLIRDATPGDLATAAIESAVRLSKQTGIELLEHAALGALSVAAFSLLLAFGGTAAVLIGGGPTQLRRARRGFVVAISTLVSLSLLAVTGPDGLGLFSLTVYAFTSFAFAGLATKGRNFSIMESQVAPGEMPLDVIRRSRRRFLRRSTAAVGGLFAGAAVVRFFTRPDNSASVRIVSADERFVPPPPDPAFDKLAGLSREITPVDDFYNVDINISKPNVDHESWRLQIHGDVDRPFQLTYRELQGRFPVVEMASTLSCISNEVGGDLVSTAIWRGVRLKDILQAAGPRPDARELIFRASDGYSDSISLEKGLADDTLVAFGMNGVALPRVNGFPARMVIPGIYGMKNVKWLESIEVSDKDHLGYWQTRGWSDLARVKTQSRIDSPTSGATVAAPAKIAGVAWAGDRGIAAVNVSTDGGKTWQPAILKRELAPNAWRLWAADIDLEGKNRKLLVRATDGEGKAQEVRRTRTHPSGASGLHSISVRKDG